MSRTLTTRIAPSPTGALHLGNARTFLVNWALARQRGWRIVFRIEDLDGPRIKPGAAEEIAETLRWLGIDWDEGPLIQSRDLAVHADVMRHLARAGLAYPSELSRVEIDAAAGAPQEGGGEVRFPASLRPLGWDTPRDFDPSAPTNWRFATPDRTVAFIDEVAGPQSIRPCETIGDFVIWTKRGTPAYQLAVVIDDLRQGVTHIVRGDDLLDSAARQMLLLERVGQVFNPSDESPFRGGGFPTRREEQPPSSTASSHSQAAAGWKPAAPVSGVTPTPSYFHLPLVRGADGRRLAKRHGDTRVNTYRDARVPVEAVIGLLASWSGIVQSPVPMTSIDFLGQFDLTKLPRTPITFTPEDDRWLRSHAR